MAFSNKFLEECLIYFKMCGDDKKYVYIVRYGICNMYGNYMQILCWTWILYIYIYIYIYTLRDMEFKDI